MDEVQRPVWCSFAATCFNNRLAAVTMFGTSDPGLQRRSVGSAQAAFYRKSDCLRGSGVVGGDE